MTTRSSAVNDSLVIFANSGDAHTSDSIQRKREWNVVLAKINNADVDWLNGNVFINVADAGKPVSDYLNKWHPDHGADQDLIDHFASSIVLKERVGGVAAFTIGAAKEVMDIFTSSVGYSNDDLATDFAGALGYNASEALAAGLFNHTNSEYDSSDMGWVDNANKILDLINPAVTQSTADRKRASELWKMSNGLEKDEEVVSDVLYDEPVKFKWPIGAAAPHEFFTSKNYMNSSWNANAWRFYSPVRSIYGYQSHYWHEDPPAPRFKKNVLVNIPNSKISVDSGAWNSSTKTSVLERSALPDEDGATWTDDGSACQVRCDVYVNGWEYGGYNGTVWQETLNFVNCVRVKANNDVITIPEVVVPVVGNIISVPVEVDKSLSDITLTSDGEVIPSDQYVYNSETDEIILDNPDIQNVGVTVEWFDLNYAGSVLNIDEFGIPLDEFGMPLFIEFDDDGIPIGNDINPVGPQVGTGDFLSDSPHTIWAVDDWFENNVYIQDDNGVTKDWSSVANLTADDRIRNVSAISSVTSNGSTCDFISFEHNCPACQSDANYPNNTWIKYEVSYNCS